MKFFNRNKTKEKTRTFWWICEKTKDGFIQESLILPEFPLFEDEKMAKEYCTQLELRGMKAATLFGNKFSEESITEFRKKGFVLIEKDDNTSQLINSKKITQLCGKAFALEKLNDYFNALLHYEEALKIEPNYFDALYGKALMLKELGKLEEALTYIDRSIETKPENVQSLHSKGFMLTELGKHEEALACFDRVLKIEPEREVTLLNKGIMLTVLKRYDEALMLYDKMLKMNPKNIQVLHKKALIHHALKRFLEANECCDHILEIQPYDLDTLYLKQEVLQELGKHDDAELIFKKLQKIDPKLRKTKSSKGDDMKCYNCQQLINHEEISWRPRTSMFVPVDSPLMSEFVPTTLQKKSKEDIIKDSIAEPNQVFGAYEYEYRGKCSNCNADQALFWFGKSSIKKNKTPVEEKEPFFCLECENPIKRENQVWYSFRIMKEDKVNEHLVTLCPKCKAENGYPFEYNLETGIIE